MEEKVPSSCSMLRCLGDSPTGRLVNLIRLCVGFLGLTAVAVAIALASVLLFRDMTPEVPWRLWVALGLFAGGVALLILSATYKINSNPFLVEQALEKAYERKDSIADIERLVVVLEAHAGTAGIFNRLDFTGASLGAVASAILVLLMGVAAVWMKALPKEDFSFFADIAKVLFGAFVGSYAGRQVGTRGRRSPPSNSGVKP